MVVAEGRFRLSNDDDFADAASGLNLLENSSNARFDDIFFLIRPSVYISRSLIEYNGIVLRHCAPNAILRPDVSDAARTYISLDESLLSVPLEGLWAMVTNPDCYNYWHWHTQALPSIQKIWRMFGSENIKFIVPKLNSWQLRSIELVGVPDQNIFIVEGQGRFLPDRMIYCAHSTYKDVRFVNLSFDHKDLYIMIAEKILGQQRVVERRPLFVDRSDSARRPILNITQLHEFLSDQGFDILLPSSCSYDQQVKAFAQASVVCGAHGAGLTNIVFSGSGTPIIELMPSAIKFNLFKDMANLMGHYYHRIVFDTQWPPGRRNIMNDSAFSVDIDSLKSALDSLQLLTKPT